MRISVGSKVLIILQNVGTILILSNSFPTEGDFYSSIENLVFSEINPFIIWLIKIDIATSSLKTTMTCLFLHYLVHL